jgi:hypothetical protein
MYHIKPEAISQLIPRKSRVERQKLEVSLGTTQEGSGKHDCGIEVAQMKSSSQKLCVPATLAVQHSMTHSHLAHVVAPLLSRQVFWS